MSSIRQQQDKMNKLLQEADELCEEGQWEAALLVYRKGLQIRSHSMACRAGVRRAYYAIKNGIKDLKRVDTRKYQHTEQEITGDNTIGNKTIHANGLPLLTRKFQKRRSFAEDKRTQRTEFKELCEDINFIKKATETNYFPKSKGTDDMIEHFNILMQKKKKWSKLTPEMFKGNCSMNKFDDAEKERWNENLERLESITDSNKLLTTAMDYLTTIERANVFELEKLPIKGKLYYMMLKAHIDLENFDDAYKFADLTKKVAEATDDEELKMRSSYLEGRVQAMKGNYSAAAKTWENLILMTRNPDRLAHLHHEIGHCFFKMDRLISARVQGTISLESARKANNDVWIKNAAILIAQIEVVRGFKEEALEYYEIAEAVARRLKDQRALISIICEISKLGKEPRRPKVENKVIKTDENEQQKCITDCSLRRPKISACNFIDTNVLKQEVDLQT